MAEQDQPTGVLRKMLSALRQADADGGPGADRSWRLALARAARDMAKLPLDVQALTLTRMTLAEVLEQVPDRALIGVLEGARAAIGVMVLSADVLASLVEVQTIGRVNKGPAPIRKPTRTDAAMASTMIDAALRGLEIALAEEADLSWAGGYRYASHIEDARPLGLLLEEGDYRAMTVTASLGLGQRQGTVFLALPAEGRSSKAEPTGSDAEAPAHHLFAEALAERVEGASCTMLATLARVSLPLGDIMDWAEGAVLPLQQASIDRVRLEGLDGRILGEGRLGQNRGMRAVRLADKVTLPLRGAVPSAELVAPPIAAAEPLRAAG